MLWRLQISRVGLLFSRWDQLFVDGQAVLKSPYAHGHPKSDADFAVFCEDSKVSTLAVNPRMPFVFKSNGPYGFYEHTKLGSELAKVAQKWNLIIYGSDTQEEGINFKLNVNL